MDEKENGKRKKYRIELLHNETLERKVSFNTSLQRVIMVLFLSVFLIMGITIAIIFFTPLKEYIPGYADASLNKQINALSLRADSITEQLRQKDLYINNIRNILLGNDTVYQLNDTVDIVPSTLPSTAIDTSSAISEKDSLLRAEYDSYKYSLSSIVQANTAASALSFYAPLNGAITDHFDRNDHLGIDITAPDNEIVKSTLEGTVVIATWSSESNYIIGIQHTNNYFSLYRYNSALIKKEGDFVRAGEPIAVIGKSSKAPNQNSLHFEIWHNGTAINPEDLISFNINTNQ